MAQRRPRDSRIRARHLRENDGAQRAQKNRRFREGSGGL